MVSLVLGGIKVKPFYNLFCFIAPRAPKITREEESAARLAQLPGIQALGPIHRTTPAIQLTESETEYTVSCIKHIFPNHVVFQVRFLFFSQIRKILENV